MTETASASGALAGVRIVDLTSVIMGPFATRIMADMGADVIKIESPEGDSLRSYKPVRHEGMSGVFLHLNRNKRSVVLNLKTEEGRAALDKLIETADVFVHALRPQAIERLGYSYERVKSLKPDIVYCGAYGFSAEGPYGNKAAYDDLIQAGSGLAALAGAVQGEPAYVPTVLCDKLVGQAIAYSVIAALYAREKGGGGQAIEVPMFETSIDFMLLEHLGGFAFEPSLGRPGFSRVLNRSRKPYRTADGYACILPYSDRNWLDFYEFVGRMEFAEDERFRTLGVRVQHIEVLYRLIEEEAPKRTTEEWVAFCDRVSIPCMPVLAIEDLPDDPHVREVGLFSTGEHPSEGPYKVIRQPVRFSAAPFAVRRHAPRLGEHTSEVLAEIGLAGEQAGQALS
ncbi:CaiB/BaiF CoA transferase family protein [Rhodoligotrophos ferricapiens]|uniref:CaiB/BaiF CoA transferase family protein n=1 Tax=Rhodoligotrophos ferricapiens TaxID=3069264 RepID=UPI00315DA663